MFFGYTFCPDYCPTTLTMLGARHGPLGPDKAGKTQVVFVTVDPDARHPEAAEDVSLQPGVPEERHRPDRHAGADRPGGQGLLRLLSKDGTGPNYTVDHTSVIYLMNPDGRFVKPLAEGLTPDEVAGQISEAMRGT